MQLRTLVPKMLHVAPCFVHNVMYILLLYTAVVVVDAHITKYQVIVGIMRTMIRVHVKGACFAIPGSLPTTLTTWPGLQ